MSVQPDHSTSGAFLVQDVMSTAGDLEEMSIASPVDREHKGPANSLYPRSPWWQTHSPTESTFPTRMHDVGFPSDTSYFPGWMALRVLGLVQSRSNILIYLSLLIVLIFCRRRACPGVCVGTDRGQACGRKLYKGNL